MGIILIFIPILTIFSALLLYRQNGKREFLRMDLVQFLYAFVFTPIFFVWFKTLIYYLVRTELGLRLSNGELYVIDTIFSLVVMYIFAFVVIHSLTKSFKIKRFTDPLYDVLQHADYYQMWLSHVVIYLGAMIILTLLSMLNIFFPLVVEMTRTGWFAILGVGILSGLVGFFTIWNYDSPEPNFFRLMRLLFGVFFMLHALAYLIFDIKFASAYGVYWFMLMLFSTAFVVALFFDRSEKAKSWWTNFRTRLGWKDLF